jgi:hypothetical protein
MGIQVKLIDTSNARADHYKIVMIRKLNLRSRARGVQNSPEGLPLTDGERQFDRCAATNLALDRGRAAVEIHN